MDGISLVREIRQATQAGHFRVVTQNLRREGIRRQHPSLEVLRRLHGRTEPRGHMGSAITLREHIDSDRKIAEQRPCPSHDAELGERAPLVQAISGGARPVNRVASRPAAQAGRTSAGRCPPGANPAITSLARPAMEAAIPSSRSSGDRTPVARARRAGGASAVAPA